MLRRVLKKMPGSKRLIELLTRHNFIADREAECVRDREAESAGMFNLEKRELLPGFAMGATDTVVDVGCGEGGSSEFAARCGARVYAVDIDPQALAALQSRMVGQTTTHPLRALLSDANPLPLADGIATHVVAQEVMEHVDDPRQFIAELVRIGRPGARYLLSVPDPLGESIQKALAPEIYWRKPNHVRVFERDEFVRLVSDAGLEIEKRLSYSFFWSMWWILFWSDAGDGFPFGGPGTPVLEHLNKTWVSLMKSPNGPRIKQALDEFMPKSQVILARKAA